MGRPDDVAVLIRAGKDPHEISRELGVSRSTIEQYIIRAVADGLVSFVQVYISSDSDDRFRRSAIAEHYLQIREIERTLHEAIRTGLVAVLGEGEEKWWRQGVPRNIRGECAIRREYDEEGVRFELFAYTNLMDLHKIVQKHWKILRHEIDFLASFEQQEFLDQLRSINSIRNIVMHPVRIEIPSIDQLRFVEEFHTRLHSR